MIFWYRLRGYKTFFRLSSNEHEISTAHKTKVPSIKEVSCFKTLKCCTYHAKKVKMPIIVDKFTFVNRTNFVIS